MNTPRGKKTEISKSSKQNISGRRKLIWLLSVFVFIWPLLYLFRDIIPIHGKYAAIDNDFISLYYKYKVYLLAHLSNGQIPLWSPSEGAGFPFFSSPFTQMFYPLNLVLICWYKIFNGYNPLDHQLYTILAVSIFSLGLFYWLRLLSDNLRAVLLSVLVMSVSFKVTEMLRFPNAAHTAAWYPWILYCISRIFYCNSKKECCWHGLMLIFFVYNLATAGYPYFFYYAFFLFVPYIILFFIPPLRESLFGPASVNWKRSLITLFTSGLISLSIILPYFLFVKSMLLQTVDRGGNDFAYSTHHIFGIQDTIGSLVYPPFAQTEGWFFFSITALLIILFYIFSVDNNYSVSSAIPENKTVGFWYKWGFKVFLLLWLAVISYISYGRNSLLFKFLWNFMPGFSQLRVWGRLNIIMVPLLAWLFCKAYADFEKRVFVNQNTIIPSRRNSWIVLGISYSLILSVQLYLYLNDYKDIYWSNFFENLSPYRILFLIGGFTAFLLIVVSLKFGKALLSRTKHAPVILLAVVFIVASAEMWPVGTRTWLKDQKEKVEKKRINLNLNKNYKTSFETKRLSYNGNIMLRSAYNTGIIGNWYFERYIQFLDKFENESDDRDSLLGLIDGRKIFISKSLQHNTIQSFLQDSQDFNQSGSLISYDGDNLIWMIDLPQDGYFSFIDNWDPYWKVFVDDKEKPIQLLFGTFKAVYLEKGIHRVHFKYNPSLKAAVSILLDSVKSDNDKQENR